MSRTAKVIRGIAAFIIGVVPWLILGLIIGHIPPLFGITHWFLNMLIWVGIFSTFFELQIIIHEFGHIVGGKLSGYTFISAGGFGINFVKKDGKLHKVFNHDAVGTFSGECLMMPPQPKNGEYPFILYILGGSFMNLIASAISLAVFSFWLPNAWVLVMFAIAGLYLSISSIVPLNIDTPKNIDGRSLIILATSSAARRARWVSSYIEMQTTQGGMRLRDIPEEQFDVLNNPDFTNQHNYIVSGLSGEYFDWLMDRQEFEKAKTYGEHLLETDKKMLDIQRTEILCGLLYIELIGECRKEEVERLYTKEVKSRTLTDTQYAYQKLFLRDDVAAAETLKGFNEHYVAYPFTNKIEGMRERMELVDCALSQRETD